MHALNSSVGAPFSGGKSEAVGVPRIRWKSQFENSVLSLLSSGYNRAAFEGKLTVEWEITTVQVQRIKITMTKFLMLLFVLGSISLGQVIGAPRRPAPRFIQFNGVLRDATGNIRTGIQSVTFAFYAEQTGGSPLWLETQNVVVDEQGRYVGLLGSQTTDGLPLDLFAGNEARWLSVRLNQPGSEEQSRILMVSVPYALKAADADTLGGLPLSAFQLANREGANGQSLAKTAADKTDTPFVSALTSTSGKIAKFTDNAGTVGDSVITESGGNIGIGTSSPVFPLEVSSDANSFSDTGAALTISNASTPAQRLMFGFDGTLGAGYIQATQSGVNVKPIIFNPAGGAVGLGTTSPQAILHVAQDSIYTSDLAAALLVSNRSAPAKRILFGYDAGLDAGYIQATQSGVNVKPLVLNPSGGRIGIGTTAPTQVLDVVGTVKATSFSGDGSLLTNLPAVGGSGTVNMMPKFSGTTTLANSQIFDNGSNVGIGTTSPTDKLQIASGNVKVTGTVGLNGYIFPDGTKQTTASSSNANIRGINYIGGCDTCSVLADSDSQKTIYLNVVGPMTVSSVTCFSDAGTPTVNLQRDDGSPANILSANLACSTSGATTTNFVGAESTLNLNDKVDFVMVSAGGVAKRVTVVIKTVLQ